MSRIITTIVASVVLCFTLAGCVTAIDDALPYSELSSITIATDVELVASPAHPTSFLPFEDVKAGETVSIVGADEDVAWLLVLRDGQLGWMPTFYSATNIAQIEPPLTFELPSGECTKYLDTITTIDDSWRNSREDAVIVIGSILRPDTGHNFDDAILSLNVEGSGVVTDADFIHTPLTNDIALILFTYTVDGLDRGSEISFDLDGVGDEEVLFQAAFFGNTCTEDLMTLNIGAQRLLAQNSAAEPSEADQSPEFEVADQPIIVEQRIGVETIPVSELGDSIPWLPLDPDHIPAVSYYGFNMDMPPFDDSLVRQAFAYATNRNAVIQALDDDALTLASSFTHPDTLGQDLTGVVGLDFNPALARKQLRDAGYPNGVGFPEITLAFPDSSRWQKIAETISNNWEAILGIDIKLVPKNWNDYLTILENDNPYHIFALGWRADYNDPDNFLFPMFSSNGAYNYTGIDNPQLDSFLEEAASIKGDPAARQKLYIQAETIILEDEAAVIPLYHYFSER